MLFDCTQTRGDSHGTLPEEGWNVKDYWEDSDRISGVVCVASWPPSVASCVVRFTPDSTGYVGIIIVLAPTIGSDCRRRTCINIIFVQMPGGNQQVSEPFVLRLRRSWFSWVRRRE